MEKPWIKRHGHFFLLFVLCVYLLGSVAACAPSDPAFDAIRQAIQTEDKDPAATSQVLKDNLGRTKDKNLIPLLLDYLRETRQHEKFYPNVLGKIAFYLEQVSEVKSHIHGTIAALLTLRIKNRMRTLNNGRPGGMLTRTISIGMSRHRL